MNILKLIHEIYDPETALDIIDLYEYFIDTGATSIRCYLLPEETLEELDTDYDNNEKSFRVVINNDEGWIFKYCEYFKERWGNTFSEGKVLNHPIWGEKYRELFPNSYRTVYEAGYDETLGYIPKLYYMSNFRYI